MEFRLILASSCLLIVACASPVLHGSSQDIHKRDLLSGEAIFGSPIDSSTVPDPGLLEVDEGMRAFVAEHVGDARTDRERLRRLLDGMVTSGLMSIDYDDSATKTALQTFHDRVGNCMSFTSLFIVLAREAGLQVTFQKVAVPPMWQADSDLIILNDHVNALVREKFEKRVIVDFNATEQKGNYETEPVSDTYAQALYFNNIAMDALREGDHEEVSPGVREQDFVVQRRAIGALLQIHECLEAGDRHTEDEGECQRLHREVAPGHRLPAGVRRQGTDHQAERPGMGQRPLKIALFQRQQQQFRDRNDQGPERVGPER